METKQTLYERDIVRANNRIGKLRAALRGIASQADEYSVVGCAINALNDDEKEQQTR